MFSESEKLEHDEEMTTTVFIDSTVGNNTQFTVTYDGLFNDPTDVVVVDPLGNIYNEFSPTYEVDTRFSSVYIRLPGKALVRKNYLLTNIVLEGILLWFFPQIQFQIITN